MVSSVVMEPLSPLQGLLLNCLPEASVLKIWSPDDSDVGMSWKLVRGETITLTPMQGILGAPSSFLSFFPFPSTVVSPALLTTWFWNAVLFHPSPKAMGLRSYKLKSLETVSHATVFISFKADCLA